MKLAKALRWIVVGVIYILISIPPILEKVPPNQWYGFRVAKTLSDERIWYAANRIMGYDMLIVGALIVISAIVTTSLIKGNWQRANRICFLVFLLSSVGALAHSFWALNRM